MLSTKLGALSRACGIITGGIQRLWVFDSADFDFTQAAAESINGPTTSTATVPGVYTAIALATGAVALAGARMYPVGFERKSAKYGWKHSRKGCAVTYEHTLEFKVNGVSHKVNVWLGVMDAASCCGRLAFMIQLTSGKILVIGESIANGAPVDNYMEINHDGRTGDTGDALDADNVNNISFKGLHVRGAFEYTGALSTITGLE